ncbi:MAG: UDP-N-acetylglucosamine 2-epimerase (non-hydrolyzing) [Clostridia bacterium]|jgi:UDP-N-acetyl-L-fucosamine synthase|nr:UDP-N-acetylglucosamine 2-epimerase (non-hydrolyzing) [Clostridia bacterium]MBT7121646.1 UDP-N-acetylglucosamine 2-epimerase (non-hydrolyzing) [Clostridia bacterium]
MSKLKLMTIVGTRPEIIRLSEIIKKADEYFDHTLVHTGQNYDYELNQIFFEDLGLRQPDVYLDAVGENLGATIGSIIAKSYDTLADQNPDALLILGDTNSTLCAIAAKRLKVPIFHMEAGNRCFDENLPEETNRRIVDHISDVNLCYSEHARRYLNAEGTAKERTYVVGSPMAEVLAVNAGKISSSQALSNLGLTKNGYILLSAHREENIDEPKNFSSLMSGINALAEKYDMPIVYSMHPRSKKMVEHRDFSFHENVAILKPLGFSDYNCLQQNAFCVVSDSGTLPEEAAILNFPAVSVRTSTERPEALDKGCFVIGGISKTQILQSVELAVAMQAKGDMGVLPLGYADTNISTKVIKLIASYTGIVNSVVWRKDV